MKKFSRLAIFATLALIFSLITLPASNVSAALADGTHEIGYEVQEAGGGDVSIADGYFSKPAKLTVEDGVEHIQITLTGSDMIKSLSVQGTPVDVVSDSGDTRVVKFKVSDASKPVDMDMHIIVPDLYDTTHGARAVFDVSGVPAKASTSDDGEEETDDDKAASTSDDDGGEKTKDSSNDDDETTEDSSDKGAAEKDVDNPPTGDSTPIALYISLLVGSIIFFTVYKLRFARN